MLSATTQQTVEVPQSSEHDLRLALLTTASMLGLLRNQFDQVSMSLPVKDDKFHAIFRGKLASLSNDMQEFQSLLPVAEQMFCSAATPLSVTPEVSPKTGPLDLGIDAERMNLFLCSKEADVASNTDTPPPSVAGSFPPLPLRTPCAPAAVERIPSKESGQSGDRKAKKADSQKKEGLSQKKKALIKFIFMLMQQKGLDDPKGHLLMDVYVEIWSEVVGGEGCGGRAGFHRFAELLRSAPEYFEVFHVGISVDDTGGSFATKQRAKMVRLVQQTEAVDEGSTPRYN